MSDLKVNLDDIQSVEKNPIELFYDGLRADATKERYTRILRHVLCNVFENILTGNFEERAGQFVRKAKSDPDWAMSVLLSLSKSRKEQSFQRLTRITTTQVHLEIISNQSKSCLI